MLVAQVKPLLEKYKATAWRDEGGAALSPPPSVISCHFVPLWIPYTEKVS
jgi:hypothetical protein